jgi:hypothetical protein
MGRVGLSSLSLLWLSCLAAILAWPLCPFASAARESGHNVNRIDGIGDFPLDYDSGSMALHALSSCMAYHGLPVGYQRLVGASGSAFKFVYDTTEAYEPLRDIAPVDILTRAADLLGFQEAHWETGLSIEAVRDMIRDEIDAGHPVLAPYLKTDAYHGFLVVTGYDFDNDSLFVEGAFEDSLPYLAIPIPDSWEGPTVSPAGWATNPIFVLGGRSETRQEVVDISKESILDGIDLMKGGKIAYGAHPGTARFMRHGGPHEAVYGLPAYDLLSSDIRTEEIDFGLIWRLDAMLGQLVQDRLYGSLYLRMLTLRLPDEKVEILNEAVMNFEATARDGEDLRKIFWNEVPGDLRTADQIADYIGMSTSIVFAMGDDGGLREELRADGFGLSETPWGWVIVEDAHHKRLAAEMEVRSIAIRDERSIELLEAIVEHIGTRKGIERPGKIGTPKKRK